MTFHREDQFVGVLAAMRYLAKTRPDKYRMDHMGGAHWVLYEFVPAEFMVICDTDKWVPIQVMDMDHGIAKSRSAA